jgi:hypothetical protein
MTKKEADRAPGKETRPSISLFHQQFLHNCCQAFSQEKWIRLVRNESRGGDHARNV